MISKSKTGMSVEAGGGSSDRARRVAALRSLEHPAISPSILSCDFSRLKDEIQAVEAAGAAFLHLDVMDGHFVPNLSYGPPVIEAIRRVTDLPLDTHLMISNPGEHLDAFVGAGCDSLTIHVEAVPDARRLLDEIRRRGCLAGISLNPPTPTSALREAIEAADLVLVMSVMPGFGGQQFDQTTLVKLSEVRELAGPRVLIEMDGGLNRQTIAAAATAGAQLFVVGSAIFRANDYATEIKELERLARAGRSTTRSQP